VLGINLVFDKRDEKDQRYNYYDNPKNREVLAEMISKIIQKKVTVGIVYKTINKGMIDNQSLAINKVNFDVEIIEREDEKDG
jgi:hypothetical protein